MHRQRTEMALLLLVVMLSICCISAAAPQDGSENKTILTKPGGDTPPSVLNQQQNFVLDINSVLRDVIVQQAKLEVEVKHLQRQNEEQSTTLKELEQQKCELQQQDKQQQLLLQQQQQELQQQQQQIQDQSTTLKELELQKSELEKLQQQDKQQQLLLQQQQQQIQAQAAELVTMTTKANFTEKQVEALRKDREVRQVAFSASLLASGHGYTGPFNTSTNLIFKHVIENIGNAYNPLTGLFTAPVRGAYHFEFYILGNTSLSPWVKLMKNDQLICSAYEAQPSGYAASSNGATLLLEVGDVVFLHLPENYRIHDNTNHFTTFSGHLLFTM